MPFGWLKHLVLAATQLGKWLQSASKCQEGLVTAIENMEGCEIIITHLRSRTLKSGGQLFDMEASSTAGDSVVPISASLSPQELPKYFAKN